MTFQKVLLPYCLNDIRLLKCCQLNLQEPLSNEEAIPEFVPQGRTLDYREPWVTWAVCAHHGDFKLCVNTSFCILNTYVHQYIFFFLSYTITGTCISSAETDSARNWEDLWVWVKQTRRQGTTNSWSSPGSHPAQVRSLSHMSLGSKTQTSRESHRENGWENCGRHLRNTCISTPKLKGWPEGQTLKNNLPPGIRQSAQARGAC